MLHSEGVEYVWVIEEEVVAEVVNLGPYHAVVKFVKNGIDYEVMLETNEFLFMDNKPERVDWVCQFGDDLD